MSSRSELVLMDRNRILRSLNRMAHEIIEQNVTNVPIDLFGIDERGYIVADTLADILTPIFNNDVRNFRLPVKNENAENPFNNIEGRQSQKHFLLIVDDVIFSGRTMFEAIKTISDHLNPEEIHTAVLIDRGHRHFPIKAEFFGMDLPTKPDEHVSAVVEDQKLDRVLLTKL